MLPNGVSIADADGSYRKWVSDSKRKQAYHDWFRLTDTPAAHPAQSAGLSAYKARDLYKASRIVAWALWKAREQGRIAPDTTPADAVIYGEGGRDGFAYLVLFQDAERNPLHQVLVPDWPEADEPTHDEVRDAA
jgi:hypothetical protein